MMIKKPVQRIQPVARFLFILFILLCSSSVVQAKTSVWQVSKNNSSIYIAGTVHLLPASEFPLPKQFEQAYQQSNVVILEAPLPDPSDLNAQMHLMQKLSYPAGETLKDHINSRTYNALDSYFKQLGLGVEQFLAFKPSFLSMMMLTTEAQRAGLYGEGVDVYFMNKAKADGKKLSYLETTDYQVNLLATMGDDDTDAFLQNNLKEMRGFITMMKNVISAWRVGDMKAIETVVITPLRMDDPKSYQQAFIKRNKNWLPKITALFSNRDKALVLVGAGHLAGKYNVLSLLKSKGYTVTQL